MDENGVLSGDLVTIACFPSSGEAAVARSLLAADEIRACLHDEVTSDSLWHLGTAIGGVKLLVHRQDADRALALLSGTIVPASDAATSFDATHENNGNADAPYVSPMITRAFRASILGMIFFPPVLSVYSTYLIFRHRLLAKPRNWRVTVAVCANTLVLLFAMLFVGMIVIPQKPPDGIPVDAVYETRYRTIPSGP